MNRDAIEREIETLKMALSWNRAYLGTVPAGADPKAEKQADKDAARLVELCAMLKEVA